MDKQAIQAALNGYRLAEKVIRDEHAKYLPTLTIKQSQAIFDSLCAATKPIPPAERLRLDELKLKVLLYQRQAFARLAQRRHGR